MSKPSLMREPRHHVAQVLARDIDRHRIGHLVAELEPVVVDVGDDHMARADMAADGGRHDADRPGPGDQHVLADQIEGERGVHGIAERIEDGADLVVDLGRQVDDVEGRDLADIPRRRRAR